MDNISQDAWKLSNSRRVKSMQERLKHYSGTEFYLPKHRPYRIVVGDYIVRTKVYIPDSKRGEGNYRIVIGFEVLSARMNKLQNQKTFNGKPSDTSRVMVFLMSHENLTI